jgi:hypothetical protein
MRRLLGKLEVKSVREGEGRMPMQFAVPGVTGEDLPAQAAIPPIFISCCARICTQIMSGGIRV